MQLTMAEIGEAGIDLKAWLATAQNAARSPESPRFKVAGPCRITVRMRKAGGISTSSSYPHNFMGGEEFRAGSINCERKRLMNGDDVFNLSVGFVPAGTDLAGTISGMTMSFDQAFAEIDGFENWVNSFRSAVSPDAAPRKSRPAPEPEVINPLAGAW